MKNPLNRLHDLGQSIWLDYLRRDMLQGGEQARLIREDDLTGQTSNPTIFQKAIAESDLYDEDIRAAGAGKDAEIEGRLLFEPENFGESEAIERFRHMGRARGRGSPRPGGQVCGRRARPAALHR